MQTTDSKSEFLFENYDGFHMLAINKRQKKWSNIKNFFSEYLQKILKQNF